MIQGVSVPVEAFRPRTAGPGAVLDDMLLPVKGYLPDTRP